MKYNTFLHLAFFTLSLIFMWLEITTANKVEVGNYTCIDKERDALLNFKSYISNDPHGLLSDWTRDEGANNDCCWWCWVTCNNQTGHVTTLELGVGGLEGKISHSLLNLSYLNFLDLSENSFNGSIPKFIGSMTQLRFLSLDSNSFSGTIPSELGNLTNLQHLFLRYLSNCTIENLDWVSRLSQLESLSMDGISLAKADNWVNVILSLKKLSLLELTKCDLSWVIHPHSKSFVSANSSFSSSIFTLLLSDNNLNSSMYHWLFPLTNSRLEVLILDGNKLDQIPTFLGNLCSLRSLSLTNNSITNEFSDLLNNLCGVSLQYLDVSHNQFTGSLSDDIQKFQSLEELHVSYNQFNGTVSENIWRLTNLLILKLSFNSFNGTVSKNVGKSSIFKADMSNLSNLKRIDLSSNNFYGHLPKVPPTIRWIDFSKNKFVGRISFLCQTVNEFLYFLDLSSNLFSGTIPECLWHFKELRILNLGQNNLFGRLPASIKHLTNLEFLNLYDNRLSGELPSSLQKFTNLTFLDLGANTFSGYIPLWIGQHLKSLYVLGLTSNYFFGTIPSELCYLVGLKILDLSMNNLHGTIPSCVNKITALTQVDPPYINRHSLTDFPGGSTYYDIEYMDFVDHAIIKWQGHAREFGSTLELVKIIDLSHNNLTGNIPNEIITLSELIALNLSMNALSGDIPQKIGLMKNLLSLDLSGNRLSGEIPTSMSQMTLLNYLDVSYNNLSGRIPSCTQLQSFEPSRYTGNAGLCGLPLIKPCPGDKEPKVPRVIAENENDEEDKDDYENWFYFGMTTGFGIGFWTICSVLLLYRRGRQVFFQFMNSLEDRVYVKVLVFIVQRQRAANT